MKVCKQCETKFGDDRLTCPLCGAKAEADYVFTAKSVDVPQQPEQTAANTKTAVRSETSVPPPATKEGTKKRKGKGIVIAAVAVIVLLVAAFVGIAVYKAPEKDAKAVANQFYEAVKVEDAVAIVEMHPDAYVKQYDEENGVNAFRKSIEKKVDDWSDFDELTWEISDCTKANNSQIRQLEEKCEKAGCPIAVEAAYHVTVIEKSIVDSKTTSEEVVIGVVLVDGEWCLAP